MSRVSRRPRISKTCGSHREKQASQEAARAEGTKRTLEDYAHNLVADIFRQVNKIFRAIVGSGSRRSEQRAVTTPVQIRPSTDSRADPRRLEEFWPRLLLRYRVQLCMTYIDHPRQISEPYDLASFPRVENGIST
jgi:hypothetical protein